MEQHTHVITETVSITPLIQITTTVYNFTIKKSADSLMSHFLVYYNPMPKRFPPCQNNASLLNGTQFQQKLERERERDRASIKMVLQQQKTN